MTNYYLCNVLDSFTTGVVLLVFQKPGITCWQMVYLAFKEPRFFTLVRF